ncbi:MAG: hypothetical protein E7058_00420 [Lentisphaerae bacterium]|nr:hypothetical protein [Lentisphaerota bacterium]
MIACLKNSVPPALPENLSLLAVIGHGGAGNIYMVQDITGKKLALKIIRPDWQTNELNAITLLRELSPHPALAQVYQTGKLSSGEFYYTMELADNISGDDSSYRPDTLAARITDSSMSLAEILQLFISLAQGMQHLHDSGIYHGDIKPENIIFVNGMPKFADFGTLGSGAAGTAGFIPDNPQSGIDRDCYALCKTFYCAWSKLDAADCPIPPENCNSRELTCAGKIYTSGCSPVASQRFAGSQALLAALQTAQKKLLSPAVSRKWRYMTAAAVLLLSLAAALYVIRRQVASAQVEQQRIAQEQHAQELQRIAEQYAQEQQRIAEQHAQEQQRIAEQHAQERHDKIRLFMAKLSVKNSETFTGHFQPVRRDFRDMFEAVNREFPEELDPAFRKYVSDFYRDGDSFLKLRKLLLSGNLSDEEFLKLYEEEKYKERFIDLNLRQFLASKENNKHINKVIRVYYSKINGNNMPCRRRDPGSFTGRISQ